MSLLQRDCQPSVVTGKAIVPSILVLPSLVLRTIIDKILDMKTLLQLSRTCKYLNELVEMAIKKIAVFLRTGRYQLTSTTTEVCDYLVSKQGMNIWNVRVAINNGYVNEDGSGLGFFAVVPWYGGYSNVFDGFTFRISGYTESGSRRMAINIRSYMVDTDRERDEHRLQVQSYDTCELIGVEIEMNQQWIQYTLYSVNSNELHHTIRKHWHEYGRSNRKTSLTKGDKGKNVTLNNTSLWINCGNVTVRNCNQFLNSGV